MPTITLTPAEIKLIRRALTIAAEDGSIYSELQSDKEIKRRLQEVEAIEAKLDASA